MSSLPERLTAVNQRIRRAEQAAGRPEGAVRLLAVSKLQPPEALVLAYRHGQRYFGESYLQEALTKQISLTHYAISWHFIGPVQSNKTRAIASYFAWVHSVDRLKIAHRLSEQRPSHLPALNICLQVNISEEPTKAGIRPEQLPELVAAVAKLPRLRLRGLMALPARESDFEKQRAPFRRLRHLLEGFSQYGLDTLSMGMSEDLEAAVMEGATWVRIGTAIFGART